MSFSIVHEDYHFLVVNKPTGITSVPSNNLAHLSLIEIVKKNFPTALVTHRLDTQTSGLLIIALSKHAQRFLHREFAERRVEKGYEAMLAGILPYQYGCVEVPLSTDWPNKPKQKVCWRSGKSASTNFHLLSHQAQHSRVCLQPLTGRTHQLRIHMQWLGFPILGCQWYHHQYSNEQAPRLLLHAKTLRFRHPITEQWIQVQCPVPF